MSARLTDRPMVGSVFASLEEGSSFFRCAPLGYAATPKQDVFDGVELGTCGWGMQLLSVEEAHSSFFEDVRRFPPGTAELDSAYLMERLETTWKPQPQLVAGRRA